MAVRAQISVYGEHLFLKARLSHPHVLSLRWRPHYMAGKPPSTWLLSTQPAAGEPARLHGPALAAPCVPKPTKKPLSDYTKSGACGCRNMEEETTLWAPPAWRFPLPYSLAYSSLEKETAL